MGHEMVDGAAFLYQEGLIGKKRDHENHDHRSLMTKQTEKPPVF